MKRNFKTIFIILAITLTLSTITAIATNGSRMAELVYNNIKIHMDGKEIIPKDANGNTVEPFVIDGTTYLPVRGIASALGLDVGWNGETQTVTLNKPGVFPGWTQVYEDDYVIIDFAGVTKKEYQYTDMVQYYANFNIKNKTEYELTFQPDAISFNDISYKFSGSEKVAPLSTGKVSFYTDEILPLSGINKITGTISVIDWDANGGPFKDFSYDAKFIK